MTEGRRWFIYVLRSPGGRVRYVGSTVSIKARLSAHLSDARTRGRPYPLHNWIRNLQKNGRTPLIEVIEEGSGPSRHDRERHWISIHRSADSTLLNVSDGWSPTVPAASRVRAGLKLKGRVFSDEHRRKISEAKKGCKRPDNADRNRRMAPMLRGKKLDISDAERQRRRASMIALRGRK